MGYKIYIKCCLKSRDEIIHKFFNSDWNNQVSNITLYLMYKMYEEM